MEKAMSGDIMTVPYKDIPDFPISTVSGHEGRLVIGDVRGVRVACFQGRVHLYEGVDPQDLRIPMYLLKGRSSLGYTPYHLLYIYISSPS